ncbi:MAG: peptidyl-prolyl cis-trans isomerase [Deltaproteobacteria bacterium]|nr:peptidyl-prolyl cis-trans isomerase [Deltaproteobacteria bacterium]
MMHARSLILGVLIGSTMTLGALGLTACKKTDKSQKANPGQSNLPPQSSEEMAQVVAQIDGVKISVGDFQDRINKQSPYIRARYTSLERKKEFLDNLVRFEVLAKEAKKRGYDEDAEVVRTMKQVMIQKLMKEEFETRVKLEDVTDAEMQKFYEEHQSEYNKPEEVRISAIVIKEKKQADKVAAEAKGPKGQDNQGFRELVMTHSQDEESKKRGGDLQYFATDTTVVPAEVVKAAFALEKTGDVAGPIQAAQGFYVVKQTGRRKALSKTFDEVKRQIQNRIYRDKRTKAMEDFVADLKNKAKIDVFEDKLAKVRVDTTGSSTLGIPGEGMDPHAPGGMVPQHPAPPMPPAAASPVAPPAPGK